MNTQSSFTVDGAGLVQLVPAADSGADSASVDTEVDDEGKPAR